MTSTPLFGGLVVLVTILLLHLLLAVCAGWLAASDAKLVQAWAQRPWRAFWTAFLLWFGGAALLLIDLTWSGVLLVACGLLFMVLSAIQGLRVTWYRSPKRAAAILLTPVGLGAVGVIQGISKGANWQEVDIKLVSSLLVAPYWAVLTIIADRLSSKLKARRKPRDASVI